MSEHEKGQVAGSAAQIYDRFFVPALFIDWPPRVVTAADVQIGDRVLDVGCGTGILASEAERRAGPTGSVVGVDINDGMLGVARAKSSSISWENAAAEALPFEASSFDRVVSQFSLMFFQDRAKAISEMLRVVRSGGRIGVAVWAPLDATPGYAVVAEILAELFGAETAKSIETPYSLGDVQALRSLFSEAGASHPTIQPIAGKARFSSVDSWIYTDIKGWTLADF